MILSKIYFLWIEKSCENCNRFIGFFPTEDMETPPFRINPISMKDAHSAESNEESIFRCFAIFIF